MMTLLFLIPLAVAMCWMPSPTRKGITTITWGTKGQTGAPTGALASAIVARAQFRPVTFRGMIEDGDGFTVSTAKVPDGEEVTLECVFDSAITWPVEDDVITVSKRNVPTKFAVDEVEDVAERKKEGMITIKASRWTAITLP